MIMHRLLSQRIGGVRVEEARYSQRSSVYNLCSMGAFRDSGAGAGAGLGNF